jgi:hypothetical protein
VPAGTYTTRHDPRVLHLVVFFEFLALVVRPVVVQEEEQRAVGRQRQVVDPGKSRTVEGGDEGQRHRVGRRPRHPLGQPGQSAHLPDGHTVVARTRPDREPQESGERGDLILRDALLDGRAVESFSMAHGRA